MKARTLKQKEIMRLSGELSPLTPSQTKWAFRQTFKHYGYRLKSGRCTCMDCGHEWTEERNGLVRCPKCGAVLEVKDTKERVLKQRAYFNVITTKGDYQVIRMFLTISEMRKGYKANPAYLEVGQYWIDPKGGRTVVGLQRQAFGYWMDSFCFGSPFEIRNDNDAFFRIADEWLYPRIKGTDTIKRNGFNGKTYDIHPVKLFEQLLSNPKAETFIKSGDIEMLRYLCTSKYCAEDIDKYWDTIKIAKRNGYKIEDSQMWFDYIKMLERMGKDLHSPSLIAPKNLKVAHDEYVEKVNRQRIKEQREADRKRAEADKAKFEELKSRYFGLQMSDGEIEIHTLDTIDEYYKVGENQRLCVASSRYYLKPESLVFTAYIGTKQIATIEISLEDYSIIQCRAFANDICEYTKQIEGIIKANTALIAERQTA